jgi:hypothetical protein
MASALYPIGKKAILDASINLDTDTIKVALVDTGTYTYSSAHDFYNDVSSAVVGTPQTLANTTTTGGTFDADNSTFTAVSGSTVEALVIYKDTGNAATSPLIAYIDSGTGLPVTPNGGDITITWNASGIFTWS